MANELNAKLKAVADEVNVQWAEVESGLKNTEKKIKARLIELLKETGNTIRLKEPFHAVINGDETDVLGFLLGDANKTNVIAIYANADKVVNYLPDLDIIPIPVQVQLFNAVVQTLNEMPIVYVVVEGAYEPDKDLKVDTMGTYNTYAEALKAFENRLAWSKEEDTYKDIWESNNKSIISDKEDLQIVMDVETKAYYSLSIRQQFVK